MNKIHFATTHHPEMFLRQTPDRDGVWKGIRVVIEPCSDADFFVLYDMAPGRIPTNVPRERRILFATEPTKVYSEQFRAQFGIVITPRTDLSIIPGQSVVRRHASLPWHIGKGDESIPGWQSRAMTIAQLEHMTILKEHSLSVICSDLADLPEHKRRLGFTRALMFHFGEARIHWFGKRVNPIVDKIQGIVPYRYHVVLENTLNDHAWTEKLADAFIAGAYVFYSGPRNIDQYFDDRAFHHIDTGDITGSIRDIEMLMQESSFGANIDAINENRRRVLYEYNIFDELAVIVSGYVGHRHSSGIEWINGN